MSALQSFMKKTSIRSRILLTYAAIAVFVLVLANIFVSNLLSHFSVSEYDTFITNSIKQIQGSIDDQIMRMYEVTENIRTDENNITFAVMKSPIGLEKFTIFRYNIVDFIY